jgi:hypothetical protein
MIIKDSFFRDTYTTNNKSYFNEAPAEELLNRHVINSSSIDTSQIDAFRQGVEITSFKHFDAGTVKIHAGEKGHELRKNNIGMNKTFETQQTFQELDYFDPIEFLNAQEHGSTLYFNLLTYPIITGDNDQIENYSFNGVIEPFSIRPKISFFSIEHPFEAHDVRGCIMAGNVNMKQGSALIDNKYQRFAVGLSPYNDMVIMLNGKMSLGAFYDEASYTAPTPFNDEFCSSYINDDSEMSNILSKMNSENETVNNNCRNEVILSSGFTYETSHADSIAFGGLTY